MQAAIIDVTLIAGGAAGNVLANRLTENAHFSVLVLEAGVSCVFLKISRFNCLLNLDHFNYAETKVSLMLSYPFC